jgi:beta-lactamase superfamily II metal-dependent hydrolase
MRNQGMWSSAPGWLAAVLFVCGLVTCGAPCQADDSDHEDCATFTLWQLPSRTPSQNMSYVMQSVHGSIIVIDGGNKGDAEYLRGFLAPLGNRVAGWFVSHPHPDHVDALTELLNKPGLLRIEHIYGSIPEEAWVARHEPKPPTHLKSVQAFNTSVDGSGHKVEELSLGQIINIDGMKIVVLGIRNPEVHSNAINNSSIVIHVSDANKSVLFTGDLGVEGGRKLLSTEYGKRLAADYVQMAHHGQAGVEMNFYLAVRPRFCLWPTPAWLWDNNSGSGQDSGPWQTLTVRQWMDEMNVERHYVSANGLIRID